jgi:hypothetical protein
VILSVFRVAPKQVHRGANGAFYDQVLGSLTLNYLKIGFKSYSFFYWELKPKGLRIKHIIK